MWRRFDACGGEAQSSPHETHLAVVVVDGVALAVHAVVRDDGVIITEKLDGRVIRVGGGVEDSDGLVAVEGDRLRADG